jgi:hypothetical protein
MIHLILKTYLALGMVIFSYRKVRKAAKNWYAHSVKHAPTAAKGKAEMAK